MRHVHHHQLHDEIGVDLVAGLAVQGVVDVAVQAQAQQVLAPNRLPLLARRLEDALAVRVEHDHALGRVHQVEHLGGPHHHDDRAELPVRVAGDAVNVFLAAAGVEVFEQADDLAGQHVGQRLVTAHRLVGERGGHVRHFVAGDDVVQVVHQSHQLLRAVVARAGERVADDGADAAGVVAEDDDAVGHVSHFLDVVADEHDRRQVAFLGGPDVEDLGAEALGGQGVHLAERLVHEQDFGIDRQGAGHADALFHAAGQLARVGVFEAAQADHADDALGLFDDLVARPAARLEHRLHVFRHRHPRVQGEALKDDGDAGVQPVQGLAVVEDRALGRLDEAGQDAQDCGLAAAGRAE